MHYYRHNIGDYRRDTAHLSLLEHGVYRQLLDLYYLEDGNIPAETQWVIRRLGARSEDEEKAVKSILNDFFSMADKLIQKRCDEEMVEYVRHAMNSVANGKLGGRPKKTQRVSKHNPEEPRPNPITHEPTNPLTHKTEDKNTAPEGVSIAVWQDFKKLRAGLRAPVTDTVIKGIQREADKAGYTLEGALRTCCERGWRGFKVEWLHEKPRNGNGNGNGTGETAYQRSMRERVEEISPRIARKVGQQNNLEVFDVAAINRD